MISQAGFTWLLYRIPVEINIIRLKIGNVSEAEVAMAAKNAGAPADSRLSPASHVASVEITVRS